MEITEKMHCSHYTLCIGLSDRNSKVQEFDTEKFLAVVTRVCTGYRVGYSYTRSFGGYIHEDGTYVNENSILLSLVGLPEELIDRIAMDLCRFFNQESVLVIRDEGASYSIVNRD